MQSSEVIQTIQQARAQGKFVDLSGIDLRVERFQNADLSEVSFSGADLSGTEFRACNLAKCNFHRANLGACKLADSDLSGADLSESMLGGATLSNCKLMGCNVYKTNFSGCNLQSSDLTGANLARAVLNAASFSEAILHGANMTKASLRQIDFAGCDLSGADLSGADLFAAKLCQCKLIKCILHKADLRECDLQSSDLSGADMSQANLEGASLCSANLTAANLSKANLINADITLADMSGADLRDADLTDSRVGDRGQPVLRGAFYNDGTEWPYGLDWSQATRSTVPVPPSPSSAAYRLGRVESLSSQSNGWLNTLAPLLRLFSPKTFPRYTLPDTNIKAEEREVGNRAYRLLLEVNEALEHNQRISPEKKASLKQQARQALDNIIALLWKLSRVRRAKAVVQTQSQVEIEKLEGRLLTEITRSSDVLEDVLMSTIQLEIKGGDRAVDRLLEDLNESNSRMRDLADAYDEFKRERS